MVVGYARQQIRNRRLATVSNANTGQVFGGHTSADYGENQYTAGALAGYDHPVGNATIGPRLGLAFSHESFDNFKEDGDTGLELRYSNLNQNSLQSSLGIQASIGIDTSFGILVPQASVAWIHEYLSGDRNIDARLVEAPADPGFTFGENRRHAIGPTSAWAFPPRSPTDSSRLSNSRPCRATRTS